MLNIGPGEMLVICVVLLLAVGPEQLPGLIRKIGNLAAQLRSMTDSFRSDFMSGVEELEQAANPKKWADDPFNPDTFSTQSAAVKPTFEDKKDSENGQVSSDDSEPESGLGASDIDRSASSTSSPTPGSNGATWGVDGDEPLTQADKPEVPAENALDTDSDDVVKPGDPT